MHLDLSLSSYLQLEDEKAVALSKQSSDADKRIVELTAQVKTQKDAVAKTQSELDRLLGILKEMEEEKHNKDEQINALQQ